MRKFNKFLIICISLAVGISLFCATFAVMGRANLLSEVGGTVLYPFEWFFSKVGNAASGAVRYFSSMDELIEENERLKAENAELKGQIIQAEIIAEENSRLYGYLSMKEMFTDLKLCSAAVIATDKVQSDNALYLTLACGSSSGVGMNMPVVNELGLIGYVCEVSSEWCKVKTLMSSSCIVSSTALECGESGMAIGDYSLVSEGYFRLTGLSPDAQPAEGEIIVTRGDGKLYPHGIPIGRVVSVEKNALNRTTEAVCEPFAAMDFSTDSHVMVITSFKMTEAEND